MYEYMRGLQRKFFKEPDFPGLRQEINEIHQALTEGKTKPERRSLLKLVDLEAELRDEVSLASFAAGFRLAFGMHLTIMLSKILNFPRNLISTRRLPTTGMT